MQANAGFANKADVRADLRGVSTALLQPFAAGSGLVLDMNKDVGPTLELSLLAKADVKGVTGENSAAGLLAVPPSDVTAMVRSTNLNADVEARLEKGVLTTGGKGIKLTVASGCAVGAADREGGATAENPATMSLSGKGAVEVVVKDVSVSLVDLKPEKILADGKGTATVTLTDLIVTPDMGGSKGPVHVETLAAAATLAPGAAPKVTINSAMTHEGSPFAIEGDMSLEGLRKGLPKSKGPGILPEVNPNGTIAVKNLPRGAVDREGVERQVQRERRGGGEGRCEPGDRGGGARGDRGQPDDVGAAAAVPADKGGGQYAEVKLDTANKGVTADVWTRLTDKEAELSSMQVVAGINPQVLNPVLAAERADRGRGPASPGTPAPLPPAPPMKIGLRRSCTSS